MKLYVPYLTYFTGETTSGRCVIHTNAIATTPEDIEKMCETIAADLQGKMPGIKGTDIVPLNFIPIS